MTKDFQIECGSCGQPHRIGDACPNCAPPAGYRAEIFSFFDFKSLGSATLWRWLFVASGGVPLAFYAFLTRGSSDGFAKPMFQLSFLVWMIAFLLNLYRRAPRAVYWLIGVVWVLILPGLLSWRA